MFPTLLWDMIYVFFKRNFQYEDVAIYNFIYIESISGYKPNF